MIVLAGEKSCLLVLRRGQLNAPGDFREHYIASLKLHLKLYHALVVWTSPLKHAVFSLALPDDNLVQLLPSHDLPELVKVGRDQTLNCCFFPQIMSQPLPQSEMRLL